MPQRVFLSAAAAGTRTVAAVTRGGCCYTRVGCCYTHDGYCYARDGCCYTHRHRCATDDSLTPYILVTDRGSFSRISLDENSYTYVADLQEAFNMTNMVAIAIDIPELRLYWSDSRHNKIFSSTLTGGDFTEVRNCHLIRQQ